MDFNMGNKTQPLTRSSLTWQLKDKEHISKAIPSVFESYKLINDLGVAFLFASLYDFSILFNSMLSPKNFTAT